MFDSVDKALLLAALLPAVVLCVYVYRKDRAEKEPLSLLLKLLVFGALSVIPTIAGEMLMGDLLDRFFLFFTIEAEDGYYLSTGFYNLYVAAQNWLGVALIEEGFKFLFLYKLTRKNKNFNSLFDGVIYAVFVSLGFAAVENVMYVMDSGWSVALLRAVMSVPGHCFFGVFMGLSYTQWHLYSKCAALEQEHHRRGLIQLRRPLFAVLARRHLRAAVLLPVFIHGFYDFCLSLDSRTASCVFFVFLVGLYKVSFSRIKEFSAKDESDESFAAWQVLCKYPELQAAQLAAEEAAQQARAAGFYVPQE